MLQVDEDVLSQSLRKCQSDCIGRIEGYLGNPYDGKSFLACLPTGAGKTGVIATICQKSDRNRILVICTRRAVSAQLRAEIGGQFFRRIGVDVERLRKVRILRSSWEKDGIYVTTFQKLSVLAGDQLDEIAKGFDLVVVDEGHSEPAPVWSRISRKFNKHRIIITATPYRNDLFQFDIHPEENYVYTFKSAARDDVLKAPNFELVLPDVVMDRIGECLAATPGARCIVKCKTYSDVVEFLDRSQRAGFRTVAIHEQFAGKDVPGSFAKVPRKFKDADWQVAIHQHMLDEGIDIPYAKVLVLTYVVSSGRELVQAVGRVVRVCGDMSPIILDCSPGANERMWQNYLEFDNYISDESAWQRFIRSLDVASILKTYLESFPEIGYYGNSFKGRFDISTFDPLKFLRIPLASFCFMGVSEIFSIESMCDTIYWRLHKSGELVKHFENQAGFDVIISIRFDESRYLSGSLFFQPTLEVLLFAKVGDLLAVFDSRSSNFANDSELGTMSAVKVDKLLNLASREDRAKTKEASARSIGTASLRAERIAMTGSHLELVGGSQRNSAYALSTVKVDNVDLLDQRQSSYYLGIGSGRVSDQKNRNFSLAELQEWLVDIGEALNGRVAVKSELLASFAMPINQIPEVPLVSVLLDLTGRDTEINLRVGDEDIALDNGFLLLTRADDGLEGGGLRLGCDFDIESGRYIFSSEVGIVDLETGEDFIGYINRVPVKVLFDGAISYADGQFYKVVLPSERGIEIQDTKLARSLIAVPDLRELSSEKGRSVDRRYVGTTADSFDEGSLFWFIDQLRNPYDINDSDGLKVVRDEIPGCDFVICTDMGTEAADFILSSPSKLCFVHMKHRGINDPGSPAGAIADVGSQALKNLEHLISKNGLLSPGNRALLDQSWPNDASNPSLTHRVRLIEGMDAVEYMRQRNLHDRRALAQSALDIVAKRRVSDAFEKEVWVVVGKGFSRGYFLDQMSRVAGAAAESLQAFQLLDSWLSVAADHDVSFKVFVSP